MNEQLRFQEQDGWCGAACIQAITRQRGMTYSQSEIATICGTSIEDGTSHYQMFCGGIKLGLQPTQVQDVDINFLKEVLPKFHVIVNWMDGPNDADDGHYSLLKSVTEDTIILEDQEMKMEDFEKKWYDIEKEGRVNRWAMIVKRKA